LANIHQKLLTLGAEQRLWRHSWLKQTRKNLFAAVEYCVLVYLEMYEADRGSPRSLPGTSKTAVPSPLVYDVVEDGTVYDMGSYIDDSVRHRLTVSMLLLIIASENA